MVKKKTVSSNYNFDMIESNVPFNININNQGFIECKEYEFLNFEEKNNVLYINASGQTFSLKNEKKILNNFKLFGRDIRPNYYHLSNISSSSVLNGVKISLTDLLRIKNRPDHDTKKYDFIVEGSKNQSRRYKINL